MKEKKIGISKIVIQLGDKETTLTVEQAKELQAALNALLGETVIEKHYPQWCVDASKPVVYPPYITYGTTTTTGSGVNQYFAGATIKIDSWDDVKYDCIYPNPFTTQRKNDNGDLLPV